MKKHFLKLSRTTLTLGIVVASGSSLALGVMFSLIPFEVIFKKVLLMAIILLTYFTPLFFAVAGLQLLSKWLKKKLDSPLLILIALYCLGGLLALVLTVWLIVTIEDLFLNP